MLSHTLDLLYNLALLVALSMIAGFIRQRRGHQRRGALLQGLLFGGAALIGMMRPLVLGPGLIFDGRSVMISLCGVFFGPLATAVAAGMALVYRIMLGGPGAIMGVLVITESALVGLLFHHLWTRKGKEPSTGELLGVGALVHVLMILLMFTLPAGAGSAVIKRLGLPILLVYPLITLVIGKVLSGQEAAIRAAEALQVSEQNLRLHIENSFDVIFTLKGSGEFAYLSPAWERHFGIPVNEALGRPFAEFVHPEDVPPLVGYLERVMGSGQSATTPPYRVRKADGSWRWIVSNGTPYIDPKGVPQFIGVGRDITENMASEAILRESEEKYRTLFDNAGDAIFIHNADEEMLAVNALACERLGYSHAELMSMPTGAVDAPGQSQHVPERIGKLVEQGQLTFETEHQRKDGSIVPTEVSARLITWHGQPAVMSICRDITERKKVEDALRLSERRLAYAVSATSEAIWEWNYQTGKTYYSPHWYAMLGYGDQEFAMTFEVFQELCHPEDLQPTLERINGALTAPDGKGYEAEFRMRTRDGQWVWILGRGNVMERDSSGRPRLICGTNIDITERKRIEEDLNFSEQKFRTLFENLAEGVALHELVEDESGKVVDYRILNVNPAYPQHTGLSVASTVGRVGTEVYGTEAPPYLEEFSQVALGGAPYIFETYFPPLEKHFRVSVISPKRGQFATVFEDVTDRKRREEELQRKNAEMERFTYMISHDLKSPLVTVRTFLGYLDQDLAQGRADRVAKDMGFIRDATGKMGRLLEDLLEVSRVGRVVNPPVKVSFADLAQEALAAVAGAIATRGVAVQVEAAPVTLCGDRPRLEEIWQNLVENAVKYMGDQAEPRIEMGVEGRGPGAVFFVRDNGMGIDPRFQAKVFDLFEKLDPTSEGTGLGLALVKRIVEFYEGRLWLESDGCGQGTCFRFTLPLALKPRKQGEQA
jgi:PAS domain S-box-containing protein